MQDRFLLAPFIEQRIQKSKKKGTKKEITKEFEYDLILKDEMGTDQRASVKSKKIFIEKIFEDYKK